MKAAVAVIITAIVAAIVLCVPDQTFEIYRVLADPLQSWHLLPSSLALVCATFATWWCCRAKVLVAANETNTAPHSFASAVADRFPVSQVGLQGSTPGLASLAP
ncbi:hypothetical protein [Bradyrhizobium sp. SZCCHNRI20481]|uniref:hypothetical protein n=1 Tax=Bradyrhizobium sp. SZCCHNRI20481 TaxID=3057286 RepID=UPI002915D1E3|nr:hypothetical protein [Bradyrhizobium sp. SZCCHNRI20481]